MSDAFAGLKLSEAAKAPPATPVDQRLFAPTTDTPKVNDWREKVGATPGTDTPSPTPSAPPPDPAAIKPKVGKREKGKEEISLDAARMARPLLEPAAKDLALFDINAKPWRKDSFLFTDPEFDRLDDLKLELRRRFDLKATKNDIARVAFQLLFEDYGREPAKSVIVRQLRKKPR